MLIKSEYIENLVNNMNKNANGEKDEEKNEFEVGKVEIAASYREKNNKMDSENIFDVHSSLQNAIKFDILSAFDSYKNLTNLKKENGTFWVQQTNSKTLLFLSTQEVTEKKKEKRIMEEKKNSKDKENKNESNIYNGKRNDIRKKGERVKTTKNVWNLSVLTKEKNLLPLGKKIMYEIFHLAKQNMEDMYNKSNFNEIGWSDREKFKELTHPLANYLIVWNIHLPSRDELCKNSYEQNTENNKEKTQQEIPEKNFEKNEYSKDETGLYFIENKKIYQDNGKKNHNEENENIEATEKTKHKRIEKEIEISYKKREKEENEEEKEYKTKKMKQSKIGKEEKTNDEKDNAEIEKIIKSDMVGYIHFRYEEDEYICENEGKKLVIYIWEFQIKEKYQRKNIGKTLITLLELTAKQLKINKIMCTVLKCNLNAVLFYKQKCNFVEVVEEDKNANEAEEYEYEILQKIVEA